MKIDLDVNLAGKTATKPFSALSPVSISSASWPRLGHGIIKRKADQVLDEFAQAVKKQLEGDA